MLIGTLKKNMERITVRLSAVFFGNATQDLEEEDPMKRWQERIFVALSWCLIAFGVPLWSYSTFLFCKRGDQAVGILTGALYVFMALVFVFKAWDIHLRKLLFIAALYLFSVVILLFTGLMGAGMVCVGFTLVLASCLLERAWLGRVLLANLGVFALLTVLLMLGVLENWPMRSYQPVWWIHAITTQVLSLILVITIRIITRSLEEHINRWRVLVTHVEYLSRHDALTGLLNRRAFDLEFCRLDHVDYFPLALVMLDVNGLKLFNDAFGHIRGDLLLKKVADTLQKTFSKEVIVARIGGDEFACLVPKASEEAVRQLTKQVQENLGQLKVETLPISISVGWSFRQREDQDPAEVFKTAEDHMYQHKISERRSYRHQAIQLILQTLYAKSPREQAHSKRVSVLCGAIGSAMGIAVDELITAGVLHDIGKVSIGEAILEKRDPLSDSEWEQIKKHPEAGYNILSSVTEYVFLAECVLAHHERWDGTGYPKGLKGEAIPLPARIIAVADAYDAMVSDRPYRQGMSHADAMAEIEKGARTQFDPLIAKVFMEIISGNVTLADT